MKLVVVDEGKALVFFLPRFYLFLEYPEVEATDKRTYENQPLIVTIQLFDKIGNN